MTTAEHILLIILSSFLGLFLLLGITLLIMIIVLVRRLQTVASKAESMVDTAAEIGQSLRKTVGSFTFFQSIGGLLKALSQLKK